MPTTAAIAAIVSAGTGVYEASQAGSISSQAKGQSSTVFGEQQIYAKQLQDLITNPSSVTGLPGYEFTFQQGSDAVARQMAASGFLGSGNEATALTQYGQGLAESFYGQQASLLASLSGLTAPSSPAQLTGAATGAQANTFGETSQILAAIGYGLYGAGGQTPYVNQTDYNSQFPGGTMPAGGGYVWNVPGYTGQ